KGIGLTSGSPPSLLVVGQAASLSGTEQAGTVVANLAGEAPIFLGEMQWSWPNFATTVPACSTTSLWISRCQPVGARPPPRPTGRAGPAARPRAARAVSRGRAGQPGRGPAATRGACASPPGGPAACSSGPAWTTRPDRPAARSASAAAVEPAPGRPPGERRH